MVIMLLETSMLIHIETPNLVIVTLYSEECNYKLTKKDSKEW
jgi:hypothetical protein